MIEAADASVSRQGSSGRRLTRVMGAADSTAIVVGSMIGSGIFIVTAETARLVAAPGWILIAWAVAGLLTVIAASCCSELAATFPQAGGQYAFFREVYSPLVGFLFGWTSILVIQAGSIAAVSAAFAKFTGVLAPSVSETTVVLRLAGWTISSAQIVALLVVLGLTLLNTTGVEAGKVTQNAFTLVKYAGLAGLAGVGLAFGRAEGALRQGNFWTAGDASGGAVGLGATLAALGAGMVGPLFSQSAWDNVAYAGEEVERPERSLPIALMGGCLSVTALYLLTNLGYLNVLSFDEIRAAPLDRVGAAAVSAIFGAGSAIVMAVVVMIATFGCLNGLILSASRIPFAMARDGLFIPSFLQLNRAGVPGVALWAQAAWTSMLVLTGGYADLLKYVVSATLLFDMMLVIAVLRLRRTRPELNRPFLAPGQPALGVVYLTIGAALTGVLMVRYPARVWPGYLILATGLPAFWFWRRRGERQAQEMARSKIVAAGSQP